MKINIPFWKKYTVAMAFAILTIPAMLFYSKYGFGNSVLLNGGDVLGTSAVFPTEYEAADMNDDKALTITDYNLWLQFYKSFTREDATCSNTSLHTSDASFDVAECKRDAYSGNSRADVNEDGKININDFSSWLELYKSYLSYVFTSNLGQFTFIGYYGDDISDSMTYFTKGNTDVRLQLGMDYFLVSDITDVNDSVIRWEITDSAPAADNELGAVLYISGQPGASQQVRAIGTGTAKVLATTSKGLTETAFFTVYSIPGITMTNSLGSSDPFTLYSNGGLDTLTVKIDRGYYTTGDVTAWKIIDSTPDPLSGAYGNSDDTVIYINGSTSQTPAQVSVGEWSQKVIGVGAGTAYVRAETNIPCSSNSKDNCEHGYIYIQSPLITVSDNEPKIDTAKGRVLNISRNNKTTTADVEIGAGQTMDVGITWDSFKSDGGTAYEIYWASSDVDAEYIDIATSTVSKFYETIFAIKNTNGNPQRVTAVVEDKLGEKYTFIFNVTVTDGNTSNTPIIDPDACNDPSCKNGNISLASNKVARVYVAKGDVIKVGIKNVVDGDIYHWHTVDSSIASITGSDTVTETIFGVKEGTTVVYVDVTYGNTKIATLKFNVSVIATDTPYIDGNLVNVDQNNTSYATATVIAGSTIGLGVVIPNNEYSIVWSTSVSSSRYISITGSTNSTETVYGIESTNGNAVEVIATVKSPEDDVFTFTFAITVASSEVAAEDWYFASADSTIYLAVGNVAHLGVEGLGENVTWTVTDGASYVFKQNVDDPSRLIVFCMRVGTAIVTASDGVDSVVFTLIISERNIPEIVTSSNITIDPNDETVAYVSLVRGQTVGLELIHVPTTSRVNWSTTEDYLEYISITGSLTIGQDISTEVVYGVSNTGSSSAVVTATVTNSSGYETTYTFYISVYYVSELKITDKGDVDWTTITSMTDLDLYTTSLTNKRLYVRYASGGDYSNYTVSTPTTKWALSTGDADYDLYTNTDSDYVRISNMIVDTDDCTDCILVLDLVGVQSTFNTPQGDITVTLTIPWTSIGQTVTQELKVNIHVYDGSEGDVTITSTNVTPTNNIYYCSVGEYIQFEATTNIDSHKIVDYLWSVSEDDTQYISYTGSDNIDDDKVYVRCVSSTPVNTPAELNLGIKDVNDGLHKASVKIIVNTNDVPYFTLECDNNNDGVPDESGNACKTLIVGGSNEYKIGTYLKVGGLKYGDEVEAWYLGSNSQEAGVVYTTARDDANIANTYPNENTNNILHVRGLTGGEVTVYAKVSNPNYYSDNPDKWYVDDNGKFNESRVVGLVAIKLVVSSLSLNCNGGVVAVNSTLELTATVTNDTIVGWYQTDVTDPTPENLKSLMSGYPNTNNKMKIRGAAAGTTTVYVVSRKGSIASCQITVN